MKKFKYRADGNQLPTCPIDTLEFDGDCDGDLLENPLLQALPEQLAELKPVVDKILSSLNLEKTPASSLSVKPSLCLGDFLGDTVVNDEKFKPTNCDDLPLKTGDKKWGLLNIRVPKIPACGRIEFCVAFDLCGSLAIGMSKDVVTCIANLIPLGQVISPFLSAPGDFTVSTSFSRNLEKQIKILQITKEENNYKSQVNPFKMPGNFYIGAGLTLPFLDFRLGTISLGELIAFEGKLGVMLDFGPGPDPEVLKSISKEISQQKNLVELSKFLRTKIKLGRGVCFFIDDGDFTIKLNSLTSGLLPDIELDNADAYVFFQFGDEPNTGIKKGFYVNLSPSVNFSLQPIIDKFLGQSIQGILELLNIKIPTENSLESNLSITVTDDVTAVLLVINSKYSIECYFPKGGKIGCKINNPGDSKFFTAFKTGAEFVVKASSALFDEAGKVIQKIEGDLNNYSLKAKKLVFDLKRKAYNYQLKEIDHLKEEIKKRKEENDKLDKELKKTKTFDLKKKASLVIKIGVVKVKKFITEQNRKIRIKAMDFIKKEIEKIERNIEEEFLLNSQSIVDIPNQNERELYFYNLGKRLVTTLNNQITAAQKSLSDNQKREAELLLPNNKSKNKKEALVEVYKKISRANNVLQKFPVRIARINQVIGKIKVQDPLKPGGYDNLSGFYTTK